MSCALSMVTLIFPSVVVTTSAALARLTVMKAKTTAVIPVLFIFVSPVTTPQRLFLSMTGIRRCLRFVPVWGPNYKKHWKAFEAGLQRAFRKGEIAEANPLTET